jgi:hypothetical protein
MKFIYFYIVLVVLIEYSTTIYIGINYVIHDKMDQLFGNMDWT